MAAIIAATGMSVVTVVASSSAHAANGQSIAKIAYDQVKTKGDAQGCNKYSDFWKVGCHDAPLWCADFAKWVWNQAGVDVNGLNSAAGSFRNYKAGANWHPVGSGYTPQPGDAALYGVSGVWAHVGIVYNVKPGNQYPDVIQGNFNNSVMYDPNSRSAGAGAPLAGFVSPADSAKAPDKPASPSASASTSGDPRISVSWSAPNANGAPIQWYDVRDNENHYCGGVASNVLSITFPGASCPRGGGSFSPTQGKGYTFQVRAFNGQGAIGNEVGVSPWSDESAVATPTSAPPSPPTGSSNGGTAINNPVSGLCLDVPGARAWGDGFNQSPPSVQLYSCNQTAAQQWIYDAATQSLRVYAAPNTRCLDIGGGNQGNGAKVQVWQCNGTSAQQWRFGRDGGIRSTKGFCLDAKDRGRTRGTPIQLWQCPGTPGLNQQWGGLATQLANPAPPPPPAPASVFSGIVGIGGVNIRTAPNTTAAIARVANQGATVPITCQIQGQAIPTGSTTYAIWDRLTDGTFLWDGAITNTGPGFDSRIPRC